MKIGRTRGDNARAESHAGLSKPAKRETKKSFSILMIILVTALLIVWVYSMGRKAEDTVQVVMLSQNVYKNRVITEEMLKPYDMLKGEFEKFAIVNSDGVKKRRVLLWEERGMIINSFAAYPLKTDTYAEYRDFIKSRVDNSDNVLYSFPGKDILPLDIVSTELQAFKTFLQPGDRLNIEAIYAERVTVIEDDGLGGSNRVQMDVFKNEPVFTDILIADLLNSRGESILDIYAEYRDMTVWQQAQLDASQSFKESVEPKSLIVALTPEEKDRYYYFLSKKNVQFKASMPQRLD